MPCNPKIFCTHSCPRRSRDPCHVLPFLLRMTCRVIILVLISRGDLDEINEVREGAQRRLWKRKRFNMIEGRYTSLSHGPHSRVGKPRIINVRRESEHPPGTLFRDTVETSGDPLMHDNTYSRSQSLIKRSCWSQSPHAACPPHISIRGRV